MGNVRRVPAAEAIQGGLSSKSGRVDRAQPHAPPWEVNGNTSYLSFFLTSEPFAATALYADRQL